MADLTPEDSAEAAVDKVAELLAEAAGLESPAVATAEGSPEPSPGVATENPLAGLPAHTQSLLRIGVPVAVTLAAQRKSVQEIIELGPGAIIKFDKTCDEPLELCVGGQPIATGEVVKVGDKFGLRVGRLKKVAAAG
jgi:flagellar motor switch protein FliN/FliY